MTTAFLKQDEAPATPDMDKHSKAMIALRYWLIGREYYQAVNALEFARERHTGFRKDKVTPVITHPVTVTNYVRTLVGGLVYPEDTLAAALLHDVVEDTNATVEELEEQFGARIADSVDLLTKQYNGEGPKKPNDEYYKGIASSPIASVVKGADRIHNFQSMVGVFTLGGQRHYIKEGKEFVLPMLKTARRCWPQQEPVYENVKLVLNSQIALIQKTWPESLIRGE